MVDFSCFLPWHVKQYSPFHVQVTLFGLPGLHVPLKEMHAHLLHSNMPCVWTKRSIH